MTHQQQAVFWLLGVVLWLVAAAFSRRAMRERVAAGAVDQSEVDRFAKRFAVVLCTVSLASASGSWVGGVLGERIVGIVWAMACGGFVVWLWRANGAEKLVRFGPFLNMPLERQHRVRLVGTILALAVGAGNLVTAIGPR